MNNELHNRHPMKYQGYFYLVIVGLLISILLFLSSCDHGRKDFNLTVEEEINTILSLEKIDDVEDIILEDGMKRPIYPGTDIVKYFGKMPSFIIDPYGTSDSFDALYSIFYSDLHALELYAQGKVSAYPYDCVKRTINSFGHGINMQCSEGYDNISEAAYLLAFMRYTAIAIMWCPDLHGLASFISDDENAGVIEITGGTHMPVFSLKLLKNNNLGYYLFDFSVNCMPSKVIRLHSSDPDYAYYLFSSDPNYDNSYNLLRSDSTTIFTELDLLSPKERWVESLSLYCIHDDSSYSMDCFVDDSREMIRDWIHSTPDYDSVYIYFNPDKCKWSLCTYDGKYYHIVSGTKSLYLDPINGSLYISD